MHHGRVRELESRFLHFLQTDDPRGIIDPSTRALAMRVLDHELKARAIDLVVVHLAALVLYSRGQYLEDDPDAAATFTLFEMIFNENRSLLNPEIQGAFDARAELPDDPTDDRYYSAATAGLAHAVDTGDRDGVYDAVRYFEGRLNNTPDDSPIFPYLCLRLAAAYRYLAFSSPDFEPVSYAIELLTQALEHTPPGHPVRPHVLTLLGNCHRLRYDRAAAPTDIDAAVELLDQAIADPGDEPPAWFRHNAACMARRTRFDVGEDPEDAIAAAGHARWLAVEAPRDDTAGLIALANAANALGALHRARPDPEVRDEGIELMREVLRELPRRHSRWAPIHSDLATELMLRFLEEGRPEDAAQARESAEIAVANLPEGHPETVRISFAAQQVAEITGAAPAAEDTELGEIIEILERYGEEHDPAHLQEAMARTRRALDGLPVMHPDQLRWRVQLAVLLSVAADLDSDLASAGKSVDLAREVVARSRRFPVLGDRFTLLAEVTLARSLDARFGLDHDMAASDEAVELVRGVLGAEAADAGTLSTARRQLVDLLRSRATVVDSAAEFQECATLLRETIAAGESVASDSCSLARLLVVRFELTGNNRDLDESLAAAKTAIGAADTPGSRMRALTELSHGLKSRFSALNDPDDLDAAIDAARQALAADPDPEPSQLEATLNALVLALKMRHSTGPGSTDDLREALTLARGSHTAKASPVRRLHLAMILLAAHRESPDPDALEEGARELRLALVALPPGYHNAHRYLVVLAEIHSELYQAQPDDGHRQAALEAAALALESVPGDAQMRSQVLLVQARLILEEDTAMAFALYAEAAGLRTAPVEHRVMAAWDWGLSGARLGDARAAYEGYTAVVELLPLLLWRGLSRRAHEAFATRWRGAASAAASWALELGMPERAVELLELGRCLMWSQLTETRTDLSRLRAADPELASRLDEVRSRLDPSGGAIEPEELARQARLWDELLRQARALPGLSDFLRPASFAEVSRAADGGAGVFVNVAERRSDALIVTPGTVRVVPLPGCALERVGEHAVEWHATVDFLERRLWQDSLPAYLAAVAKVEAILAYLWDEVAAPVLAALEPSALPRLWWIPTGYMALLPLHAAAGQGDSLLEHAVNSYTPTLRDLALARDRLTKAASTDALIVAVGQAPGLPDLPHAAEEATLVRSALAPHTMLRDSEATAERILADLPARTHVHFACHGGQDFIDTASARLYLYDGPLWLRDLARLNLGNARLAYLSACQTAVGAFALTDEAMHMAGALHLIGFPEVVATAWSISDELAPAVAERFYAALSHQTGAEALRAAVMETRSQHPDDPLLWAAYLHVGP